MSGVYTTYVNGKTGQIPSVGLTAVPATFADEAAVRTYLAALMTQLVSSELFHVAA